MFTTFLSIAGPLFKNPKVLIGILIAALIGYHFITINSLNGDIEDLTRDLKTSHLNTYKAQETSKTNANTVNMLGKDIKKLKESREITESSYIEEIRQLKELIYSLQTKPEYTDVIKIEPIEETEVKDGKIIYITKCSDIKVKKLDSNDSNNSIIKIMSGIGQ